MRKIYAGLLFLFLFQFGFGQDNLRTMFYNIFRYPTSTPANREFILKNIFNSYKPDLFMVAELQNETGANLILNTALQTIDNNYARSTFVHNTSNPTDTLQQMVFFNTQKLVLYDEEVLQTTIRDINHITFQLKTPDIATNPTFLEVYVTHLKSSTGPANRQLRLDMVNVFLNSLNSLPANRYVLFAGDFNIQNSTEDSYVAIINPANPIVMVDPINRPGRWTKDITFQDIHTQATRTSAVGFGIGGATGGIDDRFDFIMMSENFRTSTDFFYIPNTYKAFGNNGNCFDKRIDDASCTGDFSLSLRQNLHNMSDHTPVVMDLEISQNLLTTVDFDKQVLIQFASSNLVSDELKLHIDLKQIYSSTELLIFNTLGQQIGRVRIGNQNEVTLHTQNLASGIYFIKLNTHPQEILKFIRK